MIIWSSLVSGAEVSAGAGLVSRPTIAGTGGCGCAVSCWDHTGSVTNNMSAKMTCFGMINSRNREKSISWHNDRVPGLQFHVLLGFDPFDGFLVIERQSRLSTVSILAEDVD